MRGEATLLAGERGGFAEPWWRRAARVRAGL
jgi:hypothetical protein